MLSHHSLLSKSLTVEGEMSKAYIIKKKHFMKSSAASIFCKFASRDSILGNDDLHL
jgi:hypothetical protein